ncbi:peptidoglycan glycosyltransferase [Blautia liquoris]|uniref:Peptidoglycan glycosyltransferase n=1 Tax=Blautia liquoris TaxID=2779518 RepID=A0A7M2RIU2_9FIRM|nr:penicillin-binding transpeptidase domain-containing protein [Blautia liquoris]QOV20225.1 peptidoglycan glycosyltransferase [Blautia liquoris]
MRKNKTYNKKKVVVIFFLCAAMLIGLVGRLVYLMVFRSDYYSKKADQLHERERDIKAARGKILDSNGVILAANKTVCTISVIHSQIEDQSAVIRMLVKELEIPEETARKRVEKRSSIERVKTNVDKEVGDRIREYGYSGVKVDEDFKRYYPYDTLASHVLGFTGSDNQGIIGLEVKYDDVLEGINGKILTTTDARGIELDTIGESRVEPVAGYNLRTSIDSNIQLYCEQAAKKVMQEHQADSVSILLMNPQNGEIYSCVSVPEFNLNDPFTLNYDVDTSGMTEEKIQDLCNQMWRNPCINDTYEPGSCFKVFTMSAALEEGVVKPDDTFTCGGYRVVEDRRIHCHKRTGHGTETFVQGAQNSCNPVFIDVGLRLGVDNFYKYLNRFGLMDKTGVDLPGEANTIMHKKSNVGPVELATMSFGQSFQVTPMQLAATASSLVNGGTRITPHFGVEVVDDDDNLVEKLKFKTKEGILSEKISDEVCDILESVVSEGSGKNAKIEGYKIGGKTATSQTLPRSANRYISSFLGFAPTDNPKVLGLLLINNPKGIYWGGTIAAPAMREIFENIFPYLGIEKAEVPVKSEDGE